MNKDSQSVKPLSAPTVDNLIYQAEKQHEISDNRTKALVNELMTVLRISSTTWRFNSSVELSANCMVITSLFVLTHILTHSNHSRQRKVLE